MFNMYMFYEVLILKYCNKIKEQKVVMLFEFEICGVGKEKLVRI